MSTNEKLVRAALVWSILTLAGSLFLTWGLQLKACPLCFYQRTFAMAIVLLLGSAAALRLQVDATSLGIMAFPMSVAGLGVAIIHSGLVWTGVLACPLGIGGLGTAPEQSLFAFVVLTLILAAVAFRAPAGSGSPVARGLALVVVGGIFAWAAVTSSPPIPPYNAKFDEQGNRILVGCERAGP